MATETNLNDLFLSTLQDIYNAEKQILKALPKMAKNSQNRQLQQAFEQHRDETEGQVKRLERVFQTIDQSPKGKSCEAIEGIIEEAEELMDEAKPGDVLDAGLIASGQAVEHYEIARYGTLRAWAEQLGMSEAAQLLQQTLNEEKHADQLLNKIALDTVNKKAA
jgi:ferritin-like metal-binding protein YciE